MSCVALAADNAAERLGGEGTRKPHDDDREEHPHGEDKPGVHQGRHHAGGDTALLGRHRVHDRRCIGRGEHPVPKPHDQEREREGQVVEVVGEEGEDQKRDPDKHHPERADPPGTVLVGDDARRAGP